MVLIILFRRVGNIRLESPLFDKLADGSAFVTLAKSTHDGTTKQRPVKIIPILLF